METQIYSIQTKEEALACIEAGADRIGVLVGEKDGPFPCAIREETAAEIFAAIGSAAIKVLISVQHHPEEILAQIERLHPDVLHLCANYEGNPQFREDLRARMPDVKLMEAVGIIGEASIEDAVKKAAYADILILDTVSSTVPGIGAAGVTNDWEIDRRIVKKVDVPVILAGGLGPENVAEAIRTVRPFGVDSLTKTSIVKDGKIIKKDIQRVRAFCETAKECE